MEHDLPDLTPRCLIHHALFQAFLKTSLPDIPYPMATDMHPSLANLDHLGSLINHAIKQQFPAGTGWQGVFPNFCLYPIALILLLGVLKQLKDQQLTCQPDDMYIHIAEEIPWSDLEYTCRYHDPEDLLPITNQDQTFKLIICMSPQWSRDLLQATEVQSDIAFKRVTGYKEFELLSFDPQSHSHNASFLVSFSSANLPFYSCCLLWRNINFPVSSCPQVSVSLNLAASL